MSRAYRIKVAETLKKILHAKDGVSTQLEILQILSCEQMAQLLEAELVKQGFERDGDVLKKKLEDGIVVTVDPKTGMVNVNAEASTEVELSDNKEQQAWEEVADRVEETMRKKMKDDLCKKAMSGKRVCRLSLRIDWRRYWGI